MESPRASRIIAVNSEGQVLLFQHARPTGERFWATPGGGLQEGESFEIAAAREVAEELGLDQINLTPLWESTAEFLFGDCPVHQEERFFLLRVQDIEFSEPVRNVHLQEGILQTHWWSIAELERTHELVFPEGLSGRVRAITRCDAGP